MSRISHRRRRGKVVILVAILLPVLMGFGAFAIDVGYLAYSRARMQAGADSAALAAIDELPGTQAALEEIALQYAEFNQLTDSDLEISVEGGQWDADAATFTATSLSQANAVRVTVEQPDTTLSFGSFLGRSSAGVSASAIAMKPGGVGTRFLIDDEMIDTDVPSIQSLAAFTGMSPEYLLTARGINRGKQYGDNDWEWDDNFLDLPADITLELPTGQGVSYSNNDAGLFDIDHPSFPFREEPSFSQLLMYSETGGDASKWGADDTSISSNLDPLEGAAPVTDGSGYDALVNPNFVHVSPVIKSDVSTLSMQSGVPRVNAKGLRRGLIAFKIIAVGADADGGGSVLPMLEVQIVDPTSIDPDDVKHASQQNGGMFSLVQ